MSNKVNQYDDQIVARRYELLSILVTFAEKCNGALPIQRRSWVLCCEAGYKMNEESFNRHWKELKAEGFISVDPDTNTPYIPQSKWEWNAQIPDA